MLTQVYYGTSHIEHWSHERIFFLVRCDCFYLMSYEVRASGLDDRGE